MKKLVVTATAVLFGSSLFAMEKNSREKLDDYVREWSANFTAPFEKRCKMNYDDFITEPFKAGLLEEIGDDSSAEEAFNLFHAHDFVGLWKHWKENNSNMLPENAARFLDLSALATPIINTDENNRLFVGEIVDLVGKEKYNSSYTYVPQFPRFSYEMFFCVMVDSDCGAKFLNELLSHLCEYICGDISDNSMWSLIEEERNLLEIVGIREDDDVGGMDCMSNFGKIWLETKDSKTPSK
jgi:hypothetical protein